MGNPHLSRKPHHVGDEGGWWYEQPAGMCIIIEHRTKTGEFCQTKQYQIRWASLRKALARKDKKP